MYFQNYGLQKTSLDQCLKSTVSENPPKSNMVNAPKHCANLDDISLPYLLIAANSIALHNVSLSDVENLKAFS